MKLFSVACFSSLALLLSRCVFANSMETVELAEEFPYIAWFTGPLLAPTPVNMEPGHPAVEPVIALYSNYGLYNDNWKLESIDSIVTINLFLDYQFALTERTGIELQFQSFTNIANGGSSTHFGDTSVLFGYQLTNDVKGTWIPDARFLLEVIFPTGKYDRLNPAHPLREITGRGAFYVGPNLSMQKLFYLNHSAFILHCAFGYFFPSRARIEGISLYGGTTDTRGKILPGQFFNIFFAGEYAINKKWAVGFEVELEYQFESGRLKGFRGFLDTGEEAEVGFPTAAQVLFLPEIQYNFTATSGILGGGYFSVAGKNAPALAGGFLAYLYVF